MWVTPPLDDLIKSLEDPTHPIGMRMRAAYYLRQEHTSRPMEQQRQALILGTLSRALKDSRHGSLMRHEIAFIMGQLRDERCCDVLEEILVAPKDCVMVRHECAEALGAIGAERSRAVLEHVLSRGEEASLEVELRETCQLALDYLEWKAAPGGGDPVDMPAACACMLNPYATTDPAPPHPAHQHLSMEQLGDILCDQSLALFERYRAMFSLRNRGGAEAVKQLCRSLTTDTSSALLRHEVAYVLGQLQHDESLEALAEMVGRRNEHVMVRHESAEALGAIEGRWFEVQKILLQFANDDSEVDAVRESCLVALDAADYWGHGTSSTGIDDNAETNKDETTPSFAKQKAHDRELMNHFNVAQTTS